MKILFLINSLHTAGGTERVTTIITNALSQRGYEVGVVALHGGGEPFFELSKNVKLHYINARGYKNIYFSFLSNVGKLRRLYKNEKPNFVVDVCSAMSLMSILAARGGVTKVITWEHFNSNVDWNPITTPLSRKLATKKAVKIVVLSNQDARNYQKRYGATNVMVIANPVTIQSAEPSKLDKKRVLAIGRFTEQKGFDLLLESWSKVRMQNEGWELRIIGQGDMQEKLRQSVQYFGIEGSIEILPPTTDVISEYQNASIYVMSSRFEGLPLVLIEAMAMGLPIVSFDCETGPRDLVESGITGVLVEPLNIDRLAQELDTLMADKVKQVEYSKNAIEKSKKYNVNAIIQHWTELFENLR